MVCSLVLCGDCFRVALFPKFVFSFVYVVNLDLSTALLPATPRSFLSFFVVFFSFFFLLFAFFFFFFRFPLSHSYPVLLSALFFFYMSL